MCRFRSSERLTDASNRVETERWVMDQARAPTDTDGCASSALSTLFTMCRQAWIEAVRCRSTWVTSQTLMSYSHRECTTSTIPV